MENLFKVATGLIMEKFSNEVKATLSPVGPYLKMISLGVLLVLLSFGLWFMGLVFLLISLFLYLGDVTAYLNPALWTSLTSILLGLILVLSGIKLLRRPR